MKIVQIMCGPQGEDDAHDHSIYGLSDTGTLYVWRDETDAEAYAGHGIVSFPLNDEMIGAHLSTGKIVRFVDGQSAGWVEMGTSEARSRTMPHPLDPTRHARA